MATQPLTPSPRQALVTGGNRGIGWGITRRLLAAGFQVHVLSRSGLPQPLAGVTHWPVDLSDERTLEAPLAAIGPVQVLINNAGMMNTKTALEYDRAAIDQMLQTNLISAVRLSVQLAQQMAEQGGGRIVSVGSVAGEIGHPDLWYGVAKAGLMNAMRSIARSHGPQGVVATSVAPGPVETDMMRSIPASRLERLKAATITQRFCTLDEVAATVVWLATEAPASLNGEIIDLNNGANYR